ncbi:MAG: NrfD/PsrC family molybdoenzyme membrane anchor subunit [Thermoanaerobaculaceae bacterium]
MTSKSLGITRIGFWPVVAGFLMASLAVIAILRYTKGLGAVTNLTDSFPWGLWIGFDILCGVGLAAGGFAIAATVHVFHLTDFKPILRPTILTAFLGYALVIVALLFDLGKPWNIWHPIVMWNPHSVMFEVGWCVMLYTTVLFLEFLPVLLERFRLAKALQILAKVSPVLVILGVILSTLHQSSLGSLFLIMPHKLHPLWYSPILPILFFVSAVAAGLAMTVVESWFSRRAFGRPIETQLLARLSRTSVVVLALYFALRLRDLWARDALGSLFPLSLASWLFLVEMVFGVVVPMILLATPWVRRSPKRLTLAQGMVVLGFILHRLNVSITAVEATTGYRYLPAFPEFLVTMALVALGMLAFCAACKFLPVFPQASSQAEPELKPVVVRKVVIDM